MYKMSIFAVLPCRGFHKCTIVGKQAQRGKGILFPLVPLGDRRMSGVPEVELARALGLCPAVRTTIQQFFHILILMVCSIAAGYGGLLRKMNIDRAVCGLKHTNATQARGNLF